ncbi:hypothetical protein [Pseudomonas sp. HLMP]|uniref:hypothetical protein n=1 Tax=Pseudomonas sp. HLMP TaxID=3153767 RepID=UPI003967D9FC
MTADWNWFFSTLSQSTAAIVGIIGAFIIAKIFANQATFTEKNNRMKSLTVEAEKILDKIGTINFDWYNKHINAAAYADCSRKIRAVVEEDPAIITDENLLSIFTEAKFSIFTEKKTILENLRKEVEFVCQTNIDKRLQKEARERARKEAESGKLVGHAAINALIGSMPDFSSLSAPRTVLNIPDFSTPWPALHEERDRITQCHLEAKHHARIVAEFLESARGNPESPPQITWSLLLVGLIFIFGVIYPLTFMPATSAPEFSITNLWAAFLSVKGALLSLLVIAFTYVFYMFTRTNIKMKYAEDQLNKLHKLSQVDEYCEYFKFLPRSVE